MYLALMLPLLCLQASGKGFVGVHHRSGEANADHPCCKEGFKHAVHSANKIKQAMFQDDDECQRTMLAT